MCKFPAKVVQNSRLSENNESLFSLLSVRNISNPNTMPNYLSVVEASPTLRKANVSARKKAFSCHYVRLALLWLVPKIGCASIVQEKKLFLATVFGLHYLCSVNQ